MDFSKLNIIPIVHEFLHEKTLDITDKESALTNFALKLQAEIKEVDQLAEHLSSARKHGLKEAPVFSIQFDTRASNTLRYYVGQAAFSVNENDHAVLKMSIARCLFEREYDEDLMSWSENTTLKGIHATYVEGSNSLEVVGDAFVSMDYSDPIFISAINTLGRVVKDMLAALPIFTEEVTQVSYSQDTMRALSNATVNGIPWGLIGWDSSLPNPVIPK